MGRFCLVIALILLLFGMTATAAPAMEIAHSQERAWRMVEELSPQELHDVDLTAATPRHATSSYLPAETYPFTAPYTAEEMGYRLMEFTQRPRWSCAFANLWGSISAEGVLMNPGKSVTFMDYDDPVGVEAEFLRKPGKNSIVISIKTLFRLMPRVHNV